MKKVAVLGGGNGAHAAAADLTMRGFEVHLYEDEKFAPNMKKVSNERNPNQGAAERNRQDINGN